MRAVVREVGHRFREALCNVPAVIDIDLARTQHAAYRAALASCAVEVLALPADEAFPDGCFVEDTAVVAGGLALITKPGAPSRRGETAAVQALLASHVEIAQTDGNLDGGDCMRVGTTIFVGRSKRTDAAGIASLQRAFGPRGFHVVAVPLPDNVLHLKCVCAPLGDDRITLADGSIPRAVFGGLDIVPVPECEGYAANVLALGSRVLVAAGYPRTRDALAAAGLAPIELDTSEFRKADGALTCLSVLF